LLTAATAARARHVAIACLVAVLGLNAMPAAAAPGDAKTRELEQRRREIENKRSAAAGEIDTLRASDEKLERALATLNGSVRSQEADVASARQAATAAAEQSARLQLNQQRTADRLVALRASLRNVAVDAYMHGPADGIEVALTSKDLTEATQRQQMLRVVASRDTEVADDLRAAEEDLGIERTTAEAAEAKAKAKKKAIESRLKDLRVSLASQERVAADVENRLEARLGEADGLVALDASIAGQIRGRQAELARLVAARPSAPRASRSTTRTGSGVSGGLATVGGITVAASLAPRLGELLAAADADGISLGGSRYRDPQGQVAVRRSNCGTSEYDIYEKPASQCSPPTARPGQSQHEQGLAIDFTLGGALINSRSNAGFRWLASNAGRFGLANLPEEPWHWSTTGR